MGNACSFTGPPPTETPEPVCSAFGLLGPTTERPRTIVTKGQSGWSRPHGTIHKMTLAVPRPAPSTPSTRRGHAITQVRDPAESVAFCEKYLGCQEIEVPDATLCP